MPCASWGTRPSWQSISMMGSGPRSTSCPQAKSVCSLAIARTARHLSQMWLMLFAQLPKVRGALCFWGFTMHHDGAMTVHHDGLDYCIMIMQQQIWGIHAEVRMCNCLCWLMQQSAPPVSNMAMRCSLAPWQVR